MLSKTSTAEQQRSSRRSTRGCEEGGLQYPFVKVPLEDGVTTEDLSRVHRGRKVPPQRDEPGRSPVDHRRPGPDPHQEMTSRGGTDIGRWSPTSTRCVNRVCLALRARHEWTHNSAYNDQALHRIWAFAPPPATTSEGRELVARMDDVTVRCGADRHDCRIQPVQPVVLTATLQLSDRLRPRERLGRRIARRAPRLQCRRRVGQTVTCLSRGSTPSHRRRKAVRAPTAVDDQDVAEFGELGSRSR